MAVNNALLFNAAFNGFMAGAFAGSYQTDPTQADYAPIVNQAVTFATAMDAAIPTDTAGSPQPATTTGISVAGGAAIQPAGSSAVVEAQSLKPSLLQALCFGAAFQRYATGVPSSQFTAVIAALKAAYFQAALSGAYT
jgi:hypothetical protein